MGRNKPVMMCGIVLLSIVAYLLLNNKIDFSQCNGKTAQDLVGFNSRLKYVLLHLTPGITWIMLSSWFVIQKRLSGPAIDPMNGYEKATEMSKNNLTNSIEQFLMSSVSQLILIIHLDPISVLNLIPTLNLLFILGRITFWLGYPRYRSFGFMLTNYPTTAVIFYNLYQFVRLYI